LQGKRLVATGYASDFLQAKNELPSGASPHSALRLDWLWRKASLSRAPDLPASRDANLPKNPPVLPRPGLRPRPQLHRPTFFVRLRPRAPLPLHRIFFCCYASQKMRFGVSPTPLWPPKGGSIPLFLDIRLQC